MIIVSLKHLPGQHDQKLHDPTKGRKAVGSRQYSDHDKELLDYLKMVRKITSRSNTPETFVYEHGKVYNPQSLPKGYRRDTIKQCFRNAFQLADRNEGLTYVEGFATPDFMDIPIHHAWVVDKAGNVIDNTWPKVGRSYIGIPFTTKFMQEVAYRTEVYGILSYTSAEFFKNGMPPDAVAKELIEKGSEYSGNFHHAGRPGEVGGSAPSSLPFVRISEIKPEDYAAYKEVMNLDTPELQAMLRKHGLTREQAMVMIRDARHFQMTHGQTLEKYLDGDGKLDPEREKLYDDYVDNLFAGDVSPKDEPPTFFITGGLPGSGKSTMMKQGLYDEVVKSSVTIDADEIRSFLAKADGIDSIGKFASLYQEETDVVIQKAFTRGVETRSNIVFDSSMKTASKFKRFIDLFEGFGYRTEIAFADIPLKIAMTRAIDRFLGGGRFADPAYILSNDGKNRASVDILKHEVAKYSIWSTMVPFGDAPILLESGNE